MDNFGKSSVDPIGDDGLTSQEREDFGASALAFDALEKEFKQVGGASLLVSGAVLMFRFPSSN